MDFNTASILVGRMVLAILLGTIIGIERELYQKSAGLRTHIMVTFGACLFTMVSMLDFYNGLPGSVVPADMLTRQDPSRVAAQIVSGIGFIGGGAVLKYGASVRGLTTAASVWNAASIGMLTGTGHYLLAVPAAILTFMILFMIGKFERNMMRKNTSDYNRLQVDVSVSQAQAKEALAWMNNRFKSKILEVKAAEDPEHKRMALHYTIDCNHRTINLQDLTHDISATPGVNQVQIKTFNDREE